MNAIEIVNLTKNYSKAKVHALDKLNLHIQKGEIFGFIGPNGAGKTTTIRLLLDLIRATSGTAKVFDKDIHFHSLEAKRDIGYLPGEIFLPDNMTGKQCLNYYAGFKGKIDRTYQKSLIKRFDVDLNKKIGEYSKGNKQKIAIILALMHQPKLLILDEPTSGLDPLNQQTFYDAIIETKKWQATVFFSTHILSEAEKICDRVGILKNGKLLAIENIDEFKEKNIRYIILETENSIPLSNLKIDGVKKIERTTTGYKLTTLGKNGQILKELTQFPILDIKIAEPSLEDIFMHFYNSQEKNEINNA